MVDWLSCHGAKTFISSGENADLVVVVVRTNPDEHCAQGLDAAGRRARHARLRTRSQLDKIGLRAQDTAELHFAEVRVPVENGSAARVDGFAALVANLPAGADVDRRSVRSRLRVGGAELTLDYVSDAQRVRQAVGTFQHSRFLLAELATELDHRPGVRRSCVRRMVAGTLTDVDAAKGKWWSTELQQRVITGACSCTAATATCASTRSAEGVPRLPGADHLRRHDRDHEGDHRSLDGPRRLTFPIFCRVSRLSTRSDRRESLQ